MTNKKLAKEIAKINARIDSAYMAYGVHNLKADEEILTMLREAMAKLSVVEIYAIVEVKLGR